MRERTSATGGVPRKRANVLVRRSRYRDYFISTKLYAVYTGQEHCSLSAERYCTVDTSIADTNN